MHKSFKQILSLLLVVLFVSYYASMNFFFHMHTDASGRMFVHSHLYSSKAHLHSANAVEFITALTHLTFIAAKIVFSLKILSVLKAVLLCFYKRDIPNSLVCSNLLRAPPVLA